MSIKIVHDHSDVGGHTEKVGEARGWVGMSASPRLLCLYFSPFAETLLGTCLYVVPFIYIYIYISANMEFVK